MDEAKAIAPVSRVFGRIQINITPNLVAIYQVMVVLAFIVLPYLTFSWMQTPFLGAFLGPNLTFYDIAPTESGTWDAYSQGVGTGAGTGDRLISINGQKVSNGLQVQAVLGEHEVQDTVFMQVQDQNGGTRRIEITLQSIPPVDSFTYFFLPYMLGLVFLGAGLWVLKTRTSDPAGRAFAVFSASAALFLGGMFDMFTTHGAAYLWVLGAPMLGAALFQLIFEIPKAGGILGRFRIIGRLGYVLSFLFAVWFWFAIKLGSVSIIQSVLWKATFYYLGIGLIVYFISSIVRHFLSASPLHQEQTRYILWSYFFAFILLVVSSAAAVLGFSTLAIPLMVALIPLAIFPLGIAFALLRNHQMISGYFISRAVLYALMTGFAGVGYALVVSGISIFVKDVLITTQPFFIGVMVFGLALLLNPVRSRLQRVVDVVFFRGDETWRQQLELFGTELGQAVELTQIINTLRKFTQEPFQPQPLHIFIYDPLTELYQAAEDEDGQLTSDIRFPRTSGLVKNLLNDQNVLFIGGDQDIPPDILAEKPRLALLGAELFVALPGQDRLTGFLALGPRSSGDSYSKEDLSYLIGLVDQAALAIERSQAMADKDRRVHEMNVLTRVAQGVNVTLNFDDILELLYAQTRQLFNLDDFNITLYESQTNSLKHAFYLEMDERISNIEDRGIPLGQGLEREVLESRRYIITDDYERESRNRRVTSIKEGLFAWMGVPLNAGAEIIGVIAIGSRDPAVLYSEEQYNTLQAIADQAAGAIVKARLLNESVRRAKQLSSLNEVTRSLTSTLEIDPLLSGILASAVEIINCEAGSLLLVDDETDELVFEVVEGPVAGDLLHSRIAPGVGLVGKSVETLLPVTVNNVEKSTEWDDNPDKDTGFETQGLLVVPMLIKDRAIGVIEVINKKDRSPFNDDDQDLLTAFAGQAAVAVENVRLYTQTDQKLALRVEELSVMQRIDRELNASLDVSRAMRITMEWAIRQSNTTAGLIGVVEEPGLRIMASEGYGIELIPYEDKHLPLSIPALKQAVETGRFQRMPLDALQNGSALLTGAQSQLVIPIRQEKEVIGLLMLESSAPDHYGEELESFLTRLGDHASIAISNARLYAEVQRANIAKSDFVSFVSHELKTPMTSIKGYAELLAAGAVGEINEGQQDFINTIRVNIGRMATLVSDLADVSRIEAGRLHLEFAPVALDEIVDEVIRSTQAMIDEKEQILEIDMPEDLPDVWGDRNRLAQILTNLVSNAHKYTLEGGKVTIRGRLTANTWDAEGAPQVVHLQIIDSGIGIKEEDKKKIFTQYFRTEEGKDTAPGTGLGLNITKNLVEMQGGIIWFESEYGSGTTFQFTIPISEPGLN